MFVVEYHGEPYMISLDIALLHQPEEDTTIFQHIGGSQKFAASLQSCIAKTILTSIRSGHVDPSVFKQISDRTPNIDAAPPFPTRKSQIPAQSMLTPTTYDTSHHLYSNSILFPLTRPQPPRSLPTTYPP